MRRNFFGSPSLENDDDNSNDSNTSKTKKKFVFIYPIAKTDQKTPSNINITQTTGTHKSYHYEMSPIISNDVLSIIIDFINDNPKQLITLSHISRGFRGLTSKDSLWEPHYTHLIPKYYQKYSLERQGHFSYFQLSRLSLSNKNNKIECFVDGDHSGVIKFAIQNSLFGPFNIIQPEVKEFVVMPDHKRIHWKMVYSTQIREINIEKRLKIYQSHFKTCNFCILCLSDTDTWSIGEFECAHERIISFCKSNKKYRVPIILIVGHDAKSLEKYSLKWNVPFQVVEDLDGNFLSIDFESRPDIRAILNLLYWKMYFEPHLRDRDGLNLLKQKGE